MSLNYNIEQAGPQSRGRRERQRGRPLGAVGVSGGILRAGTGISPGKHFSGATRGAEAGKKRRLPPPPFTAQTGMGSWLATSSRRPGPLPERWSPLRPNYQILSLELEVPSHARWPKVWRLFINRLPEFRWDRSSRETLRSAGLSGPEHEAVQKWQPLRPATLPANGDPEDRSASPGCERRMWPATGAKAGAVSMAKTWA